MSVYYSWMVVGNVFFWNIFIFLFINYCCNYFDFFLNLDLKNFFYWYDGKCKGKMNLKDYIKFKLGVNIWIMKVNIKKKN